MADEKYISKEELEKHIRDLNKTMNKATDFQLVLLSQIATELLAKRMIDDGGRLGDSK